MAKLTKEYTTDQVVKTTLNFMGADWTLTEVPTGFGSKSLEKCFDVQVKEKHPDMNESILEALDSLCYTMDDEDILECLDELGDYEEAHNG